MLQHCRTCRCESAGEPGSEAQIQGVQLFDEHGKEISMQDLYPDSFPNSVKAKSPEFEEINGQILSPCCTVGMDTNPEMPSYAKCRNCGKNAAVWNDDRKGWDRIPEQVSMTDAFGN